MGGCGVLGEGVMEKALGSDNCVVSWGGRGGGGEMKG